MEQQNRTIGELQNEMRLNTNSHAQSISNFKMMVGQFVFPIQTLAMIVKKDKFLS